LVTARAVGGDEHSQAFQMTVASGENERGPDNRHRGDDQSVPAKGGRVIDIFSAPAWLLFAPPAGRIVETMAKAHSQSQNPWIEQRPAGRSRMVSHSECVTID
jgi:hypothetical protein